MSFDLTAPGPLSVTALLLNLAIGAIISGALSWHFQRFGQTMSNPTCWLRCTSRPVHRKAQL